MEDDFDPKAFGDDASEEREDDETVAEDEDGDVPFSELEGEDDDFFDDDSFDDAESF